MVFDFLQGAKSLKRYKIEHVGVTNRKSYMGHGFVQKSMTSNDPEW